MHVLFFEFSQNPSKSKPKINRKQTVIKILKYPKLPLSFSRLSAMMRRHFLCVEVHHRNGEIQG